MGDLAAQYRDAGIDRVIADLCRRMVGNHIAFGVIGGGGPAQPDGGRIGLRCRGDQTEDLGGAFDADHQYAGGHRVQGAGVADLAGAENPATTSDDVVTGHPGGFVDDDDAGLSRCHSTIAVKASPPATDHRPASSVNGGPDRAAGSIRIRETNSPAVPSQSTVKVM